MTAITNRPEAAPLQRLNHILMQQKENSKVAQLFQKVKEISEENYLPWKDAFCTVGSYYIDAITTVDLTKPIMWGIAPGDRPFLVFGYSYQEQNNCSEIKQESITIYQQNPNNYNDLQIGNSDKMLPYDFSNFETLLEGKELVEESSLLRFALIRSQQLRTLTSTDRVWSGPGLVEYYG
ncbi:MAG: hypothetical protein JSR58_01280 [Verrucomicrobia bacterium]|nr:hypothetical protein [Verrucomicrobiota bacterium]